VDEQLSLFEAKERYPRRELALALTKLAEQNVFIGTSSWRYEGWLGQIYTEDRYTTQGKFSKQKFTKECLQEYAEVFPIIGADFSFYAIPTPEFWKKTFGDAPKQLKWSLKVPEEFTRKQFSSQQRYGERKGLVNGSFLDADHLVAGFLDPLAPYHDRLAVLIFEFGTFSKRAYPEVRSFCADLDKFLARLPKELRYCVELRNEEFLTTNYFELLRTHGVAHTFNSWSRMPSLRRQSEIEQAFTAPFSVARALLRPGRPHDEAVARFSPYSEIRDEYPNGREGLRSIIRQSREKGLPAYIHVNNRLEGNAPETIRGVVNGL
jgi:uncharacterized protein YecE (DUF72 family)